MAWCPNQNLPLIAVAAEQTVFLVNSGIGDHVITKKADELLEIIPQSDQIGMIFHCDPSFEKNMKSINSSIF